jgi:hypothetical protein
LFRRTKSDRSSAAASPQGDPTKPGGKGRPTPTRREAEAAAKARAKVPRTRKEQARAQRQAKSTSSQEMREGMKRGEEKYLPARDRGPVRRFIRDFIDARFSFLELVIPLMILTLALGYSGNTRLMETGNNILLGTVLLILVETTIIRFRLRKELQRRFPGEQAKRPTLYAVLRGTQMRFMRIPKPQVKIGQNLPEHYR